MDPTQEQLQRYFRYEPETGKFYHRERTGGHKGDASFNSQWAGREIRNYSKHDGYNKVFTSGRPYQAARCALIYMGVCMDGLEADHINRIRTDDRYANLRAVSGVINKRNRGVRTNNTSGCTGVHWAKTRSNWIATIVGDAGVRLSKSFNNLLDATAWRKSQELRLGYL